MKKSEFTKQLKEALNEQSVQVSQKNKQVLKDRVFKSIVQLEDKQREKDLLQALRSCYKAPSKTKKMQLRNALMEDIRVELQSTWVSDFVNGGILVARKSLAMSFAFMIVGMTLIIPLHLNQQPQYGLHLASAAYLECEGEVYLDGILCKDNELLEVQPGTVIKTEDRSKATILYDDYSVVRIHERTEAKVDDVESEKIFVSSGEVWVNAPNKKSQEPLKVTTPVLKAKIPQGSAGISAHRNQTELMSSTAVVEVQIDSPQGETEVVTLAPQKMVRVQKSATTTRIRQSAILQSKSGWVQENTSKDKEHLAEVREKTIKDNQEVAGSLPGEVSDYLSKVSQTAQTALIWNEDTRLSRKAGQLDELLAEMILLYEKGDKTTAEKNFEVYKQKFSSLIQESSDKLSVNTNEDTDTIVSAVLRKHTRLVSPFSSEDPQFVLKKGITELASNLELSSNSPEAEKLAEEALQQKFIEAKKTAEEGKIAQAEEILIQAASKVAGPAQKTDSSEITSDLKILSEIANESEQLKPIVSEIKKKKVEGLRAKEPVLSNSALVTGTVTGTAFKEEDKAEGDEENEERKTSKVVGQAVLPEEESL